MGNCLEKNEDDTKYDECVHKGKEALNQNLFNKSLIYFDKAIAIDPNRTDAYNEKGKACFNEAIKCCDKASKN